MKSALRTMVLAAMAVALSWGCTPSGSGDGNGCAPAGDNTPPGGDNTPPGGDNTPPDNTPPGGGSSAGHGLHFAPLVG
jgi:hypothetical protein